MDGARHVYDNSRYLCCPTSMPVKAGTPAASTDNPLYGVYIALDARLMGELAMEMDNAGGGLPIPDTAAHAQGIRFARWDNAQHMPLPLS